MANFATSFTIVVDTGGKFATGVNDNGGKFAAGVQPMSTTPAANSGNNIRLQIPYSDLEAKIYKYVKSTIQRCPNKIIKIFQIEDFFHLPLVSTTQVVNLELRISP